MITFKKEEQIEYLSYQEALDRSERTFIGVYFDGSYGDPYLKVMFAGQYYLLNLVGGGLATSNCSVRFKLADFTLELLGGKK